MKNFKKITEENFEQFIEEGYSKWLPDRVEFFLFPTVCDYQLALEQSLIDCESPIEQLLAFEIENIGLESIHNFNPFIDVVSVQKQQEIQGKNKKYRVDFLIPVVYKNQENKCFVVECDGYEFHQKTKK